MVVSQVALFQLFSIAAPRLPEPCLVPQILMKRRHALIGRMRDVRIALSGRASSRSIGIEVS